MASRNTQQEAETLKVKLEAQYPDLTFRVEPSGSRWNIWEIRLCEECGAEIRTHAIGEDGLCKTCRDAFWKQFEQESADRAAHIHREIAEYEQHQIQQDER